MPDGRADDRPTLLQWCGGVRAMVCPAGREVSGALLLPASARIAVPWRNGGGVTREVASFLPLDESGMAAGGFLWRVSIAEVATPGPFSIFPNVDRILTVLDGTLRLSGPDAQTTLSPERAPFFFAGDVDVAGEPIGGPVRDLNVMVARGAWHAMVARIEAGAGEHLAPAGTTTVLVATGTTDVHLASGSFHLDALDAVLIDGKAPTHFHVAGAAATIAVALTPVTRTD